jgi:hypothetical protein
MDSLLREIIADNPKFHIGETDLQRSISDNESFFDKNFIKSLNEKEAFCFGIGPAALYYKPITKKCIF